MNEQINQKTSEQPQPSQVPDIILRADEIKFAPFNIPGFSGETHAAFPNTDISKAPFIALLRMKPGAVLRKHFHPTVAEAVYVVEGEMINDGEILPAGSFLIHGAGVVHGPHATEKGCTLMFIQSSPVGKDDSVFVD
jgi:quercetin dioxygenase-like cupin family protein